MEFYINHNKKIMKGPLMKNYKFYKLLFKIKELFFINFAFTIS